MGEWVRWRDATVHVLVHSLQFGSSLFEGIRCYETPEGPAIFRLDAHLRRLKDSAQDLPDGHRATASPQITEACPEIVARNGVRECYIRPMVVRGYGSAGLSPVGSTLEVYIACWPWGTYLGEGALEQRGGREGVQLAAAGAQHLPGGRQGGGQLPATRSWAGWRPSRTATRTPSRWGRAGW